MTNYSRAAWDSVAPGDVYSDIYGDYGLASVDSATANRTLSTSATDTAGAADAVTYVAVAKPQYFAAVGDVAGASDAITGLHASRINIGVSEDAGASDSATAAITYRVPAGGVHLRVWDKTGVTLLGILPEVDGLHVNVEHNDVGGIDFDYPLSGKNIDALTSVKTAIISAHEGNRELATAHWTSGADDPGSDEGKDRLLSVVANGTLDLLSWVGLYPDGGFNHLPKVTFGSAAGGVTPGSALLTLLNRGQARGCLDGVTAPLVVPTFTATHDSAGQPWPFFLWLQYDAGQDLLFVTRDLVERGYIDTRMRRFSWDVYVQDTTLAGDRPDVELHRSRELESSPRTTDRTAIRTALLMVGEGNVSTEVVDAAAINVYGRREGNSGQSGISRASVLTTIGAKQIADLKRLKEGFTATYDRTAGGPQPLLDYTTGEFIRADWYVDPNTGANLPLRVRTITATYDSSSVRDAEVELGDLFLEAEVVLQRQVEALTKGTSSVVSAPPTPVNADASTPLPPATVAVDPGLDVGADGRARAWALISWPQVTANDDGTVFDDDGGYRVSWSVAGGLWTGDVITAAGDTSVLVPALPPGATFEARVAATDYNGHISDYRYSASILLLKDTTAPPAPTAPTVDPTLGGVQITWDGLPEGHPTVQWPTDFDHVAAFVSQTDVFADATAVAGELTGPGTITAVGLDYNVPYFAWLVAYDQTGNASDPSDTGAGGGGAVATPTQVLAPDLGGGAVGPDALAYRDFGNKVPDGSFELQATRDRLTDDPAWASGVWSFVTGGASDGGWWLRGDASVSPATIRSLPLVTGIEAIAGDKVWFTFNAKGSAGATGSAQLVVRARDSAGLVIAEQVLVASTASGAWLPPDTTGQSFTYTFPANIATYDVLVRLPAAAQLGTWGFDAVNMRQVIQTEVIDQEAVGNAQIANLAVDTGKVRELNVTQLSAGQLLTPYIALHNGMLTTADTGVRSGQRVEFDAAGIRAYNSSGVQTVRIGSDGTATFAGTIGTAGLSGGLIVGTEFYASSTRPRVHISTNPIPMFDDDPNTAGIKFEGIEAQVAEPRVIGYRYQSTVAPDFNTGIALRGGIANLASLSNAAENAITVHPRDQTDEQDVNIDGFGQVGIAFDVCQYNADNGTNAEMRVVLRGHYGNGYNYPGFYFWENDVGIGFDATTASGQLSVVNYMSDAYVNVRAAAYTSPSAAAAKDDVTDVDAVAIIRAAPSRKWRYKNHPADAPHGWKVGPMADDLPEWLHELDGAGEPGLAAHTVAGLAWEAVRQLAARLDELAAKD